MPELMLLIETPDAMLAVMAALLAVPVTVGAAGAADQNALRDAMTLLGETTYAATGRAKSALAEHRAIVEAIRSARIATS